jgi:hypothetical protein
MKKVTITISTILIVGFFAASVFAWGCGGMYGYGNNNGYGYNNSAYQSFYSDTQALRTSITVDRTELSALMASSNPDTKRVRALSEKISNAENELRLKAQQNNLSGMGMMGYGQGWNCGIAGHNHNFAGCW